MAFPNIATITASIAALSVSGLTIVDTDGIPEGMVGDRAPMLFPKPDGFVTAFELEYNSFGDGSTALQTVNYTLTYRFCYRPIGSDRGLFATYPGMVVMAFNIINAMAEINNATAGAAEIVPQVIENFDPVADPAGNLYHGCDIGLRVTEFKN